MTVIAEGKKPLITFNFLLIFCRKYGRRIYLNISTIYD